MNETSSHHVLIVEDEKPIRRFLKASLENEGYRVSEAATGDEAIRSASSLPPDLVILDLGLPDTDGQELLRRFREWFTGPIVILSARDQEPQKVQALDGGADDYLTKPFGVGELLARIRVAIRHANRTSNQEASILIGTLRAELVSRLVTLDGKTLHLTPLEYKLLITLMKNAGKVLTHRYLLREVWGPHDSQEFHYLRVFVASLRKKIEADSAVPRYILTEQGVGYRFATE